MSTLSVIIPTYNRQDLLRCTLTHLAAQRELAGDTLEVVIVDDGSTDQTAQVVDQARADLPNLTYLTLSRQQDNTRRVSRVRNLGVEESSGDLVTFLDCGVLVPPLFVRNAIEKCPVESQAVLLHYVLGLFTHPDVADLRFLESLTPETLPEVTRNLSHDPLWLDARHGLFDAVADDLRTVSAPWALCWTCALTAPKALIEEAGGFDETYAGWGSEDTALGYEMHRLGATFAVERERPALHVPHPREKDPAKSEGSNFANRLHLHQKHYQIETELYPYFSGPYYGQALDRIDALALSVYTQPYPPALLACLADRYVRPADRSLLVGTDSTLTASSLPTTHLLAHNRVTHRKFGTAFPDRTVEHLLGCHTPYANLFFDVAILTDMVPLLPPVLRRALLRELDRITRTLILVYTDEAPQLEYAPESHAWGFDMPPWEEIERALAALDLRAEEEATFGPVRMLAVKSATV